MRYLLLFLILYSCSQKESNAIPLRLKKGAQFVKAQLTASYIKNKTVFLSLEGERDISAWYEYFFSSLNTRDWITETNEFGVKPTGLFIPDSVHITYDGDSSFIKTRYKVLVSINVDKNAVTLTLIDTAQKTPVGIEEVPFPRL